MQKRTREILALLLLGILALVGVGAMAYYIFIGHNWNVAASNIDDRIGQLDGYTVVLYEGTRPLEDETTARAANAPGSSAPASAAASASTSVAASASSSAVSSSSAASREQAAPDADIEGVVESYREKGANVFVVDAASLSRYSDPFVVAKNCMRIGLFSVGKATLRSAARADAQYLSEYKVNYSIAVTNDTALCDAAADGLIGNVSIIVCDDPEGEFPDGRYSGSTYCVRTPYVGEVGAVLISPSGVLSSKTVGGRQDV